MAFQRDFLCAIIAVVFAVFQLSAAIPPPPGLGMCPRISRGVAGICVEDCSSNYDCRGGQVCCSNGCGHTCQTPIPAPTPVPKPKPGTCPRMAFPIFCPYGLEARNQDQCTHDHNCPGEEKCCRDGCFRKCQAPIISGGTCPREILLPHCPGVPRPPQCRSDENCPIGLKCCFVSCLGRICTMAVPTVKPGTCPRLTIRSDALVAPGTQCKSDAHCPGNQKCCQVSGGRHICQNPAPVVKPGTCPLFRTRPCPEEIIRSGCSSDSECPGNKKCCTNGTGCGRFCSEPWDNTSW